MKKGLNTAVLVNTVVNMIARSDGDAAERFSATFGLGVGSVSDTIDALNRYWRYQLAILNIDTVDQRECLGYSRSPEAWLANFETYILPTVKTYRLPTMENRNG